MNIQEGIKELESHKMKSEDIRAIRYNDGINAGIAVMKKLDEPQPAQQPVVPKAIAALIEKYKEDGVQLIDILVCFKAWSESEEGDYRDEISWVVANPETFMRAWLIGYEDKKERLYEVIIGDLYLIKKFNDRNDFCFNDKFELCWWEKSAYQLTEAEIKAIDERFWLFAVPVEEVAEG